MTIKSSLKRGFRRIAILASIGIVCLLAAHLAPLLLGPTGAPLAFGFGLCFVGLAVRDIAITRNDH